MSFAFSCRALLGVCALVSATAWAQIRVADVAYSASTTVQGQTLQLNGAGVRHKAVFKVYTAGLYLGASARSGAEVVALPGPKRLRIVMLREIDSGELGKLFSRGMEENMDKAAFSKLVPGVLRMSQVLSTHKKHPFQGVWKETIVVS